MKMVRKLENRNQADGKVKFIPTKYVYYESLVTACEQTMQLVGS